MRSCPILLIEDVMKDVEPRVLWQYKINKKGVYFSDMYWCVKEQILAELLGLDELEDWS